MGMTGRVGIGFDTHRFASGRVLVLGGVPIPHNAGLDGHADADVLIHAIVDALLGGLALGNIGTHFPNTEPEWKDAPSERFLRGTLTLVRDRGFRVANVDATLVAEMPKLSPHIDAIRASLAEIMQVGADTISVKATTAEGMGAIGRAEGIACMAVAMLEPEE